MGTAHPTAGSVLETARSYQARNTRKFSVNQRHSREHFSPLSFKLNFLGAWGPLNFMHGSQTPKY